MGYKCPRVPKKSFAKQICALREAEGLSQSEAAASWGVSLRTLQKWEQGERVPSMFVAKCTVFWIECRNRVSPEKRR
jgi:DNA-binding transcriptional regulator YiaG